MVQTADRLLRIGDVMEVTGMSRSALYQMVKDGRFPPSLQVGPRAVAWRLSDVESWIAALEPAPN